MRVKNTNSSATIAEYDFLAIRRFLIQMMNERKLFAKRQIVSRCTTLMRITIIHHFLCCHIIIVCYVQRWAIVVYLLFYAHFRSHFFPHSTRQFGCIFLLLWNKLKWKKRNNKMLSIYYLLTSVYTSYACWANSDQIINDHNIWHYDKCCTIVASWFIALGSAPLYNVFELSE